MKRGNFFHISMRTLLIQLIIILSMLPETIYSTVQESNLIKLLTALANERLGEKSDSVKFKFWKCINPAGAEPRKYAKCLVRLMRTKNVKNFAPKSADELLAHDLALMSEFKEKSKVIRKLRFNLLTVHDKEVQSRKIATNTIDDQDRGQKFIDDQLERFQYMLNKLNLKEDRVLNILNQVSNLSRYIADRFPKSRFALSTTKNEARYQGSTSSARILSPRFFTMEDDGGTDDQWTLLSPDLFSLYENNKTNNILSLPSLIEDVPTPEKSFWWKFIAETVSTVKDDVRILSWNRSLEILYKEYGMDDVTVRNKISKFFDMLDDWQLKDLGGKGYTVLKDFQYNTLHRNKTAHYKMVGKLTMKRALEEAVLNIARGRSHSIGNGRRRRKRALAAGCILKPSVGNVIIFTHFIVSYIILCPAALGIFILGSLVLTPFILTPYVLFPFILSPYVLVPVILSPHALAPTILSPGVLSPFILDPNVLSPTILSPFVLCPFILSPSCLSPVILSPGVLSPAILSPSCLSPSILSPCALCG